MQMGRKVKLAGDLAVVEPKTCACCGNGKLYLHTDEETKENVYYCKSCFDLGCMKCDSKTFK